MSVSCQRVSVCVSQCQYVSVNGQRVSVVIVYVSKWSKSVSNCLSVSVSDSTRSSGEISRLYLLYIGKFRLTTVYMSVSGQTHLRPTPVISKIVWLCNQKLLVSLYYVLIYAVDMLI